MGFNMYNFTLKNTAVFMLIMLGLQPALNAAEMAEDIGAWIQSVAEGSLGGIDPSLQKSRVWLETQSRFDGDWSHWY